MQKRISSFWAKHSHNTRIFIALALIVGLLLLTYDIRYLLFFGSGWDYINNIIVEAHGLLFDLLVLGVLVSIYESRRKRKEDIKRDEDLIDDFRGWDEKEAMFRIVGAVRRLNKLDVSAISLYGCFLSRADLCGAKLSGANLFWADLSGALLIQADLSGAKFYDSDASAAQFSRTKLDNTDLSGANLKNAVVGPNWFEYLATCQVIGRDEIVEKYYINKDGRLIEKFTG